MSKVLIEESNLSGIASAIRSKLGAQTTYKPSQMAEAIASIAPQPSLETKSIIANGTYTPSTGKDGFSQVTVDVPNSYAAGDEGKVVSSGALVAQTARAGEITANGTYDTTENNSVTVNVSGGGESTQLELYELYGATFAGYTQTFKGVMNNKYIACCFHDNMSSTYQLNGITESFPESVQGKNGGIIYGVTKEVTNNADHTVNAIRKKARSLYQVIMTQGLTCLWPVGG